MLQRAKGILEALSRFRMRAHFKRWVFIFTTMETAIIQTTMSNAEGVMLRECHKCEGKALRSHYVRKSS